MEEHNEILEGEVWDEILPRELPMRWHNFLIYFSLWFGALRSLSSLGTVIYAMVKSGSDYWNAAPVAYRVTNILEFIYIAASICLMICVRFRLAQRKRNAPRLLLILYGLNIAGRVLFRLAYNLSLGLAVFANFKTATVIGAALMILANNKYYYRRRHLFIN